MVGDTIVFLTAAGVSKLKTITKIILDNLYYGKVTKRVHVDKTYVIIESDSSITWVETSLNFLGYVGHILIFYIMKPYKNGTYIMSWQHNTDVEEDNFVEGTLDECKAKALNLINKEV